MAKMSLEQLRRLREEKRREVASREVDGKDIQIIVGMGTCGIAAGAKQTFDAVVEAVNEFGLGERVVIRQTGC
ncbi:MAG TPA: (2Fe-2S) ferredoxin domain-containing protein, partial [Rectinemataceae bacterium]|nr:(2Fe-2S) ferredoxin domain-containing protein [Rectinemataceae bacterium]